MLYFDTQHRIDARIDAAAVSLQPGYGVHRLVVYLELRVFGFDAPTACTLEADLLAASPENRWLTSAAPANVILRGDTGHTLYFPLSNDQLLAVEDRRAGRNLPLRLRLKGTLFAQSGSPMTAEGERHLQIPASVWQDAMEHLDKAVSFTMTIPLPATEGAHREAAEHLRSARRLLNAGEFDKAIGSARQVMELVGEMAGWRRRPLPHSSVKECGQKERWEALYKAAFDQASGAEHADGLAKDFFYSRSEAEALIGIATSLLKATPDPLP